MYSVDGSIAAGEHISRGKEGVILPKTQQVGKSVGTSAQMVAPACLIASVATPRVSATLAVCYQADEGQ